MPRPRLDNKRAKCSFTLDSDILDSLRFMSAENMSRTIEELLYNYYVRNHTENSFTYYTKKYGIIHLYDDGIFYFADEDCNIVEELGRHRTMLGALQSYRKLVDSEL